MASLASHVPFRSRHLATWDSVLFALAIDRYSILEARPHPPGYPVYIAMARMAQPLFGDANSTLVAISLLLAAGSVGLVYALGHRLAGRRVALVAALVFAMSPVLAHNSVLATSYPGEALFAVLVAAAGWHARRNPGTRSASWLGGVFLLALGFRQSLLFYLTPLVAWALLAAPRDARALVRRAAAFGVTALAVGLAWLLPLLAATGGFGPYRAATALQTRQVVFAQTVFTHGRMAWIDHWDRFVLYVRPEATLLLPVLVVLGLAAAVALRSRGLRWTSGPRVAAPEAALFLLLWIGPAVLFYLLIFDGWGKGPDGYALVLLPAVALAFALLAVACVDRLSLAWPSWQPAIGAAFALLLLVPVIGLGSAWGPPLAEVREHDAWIDSWQRLETDYPANDTAIVASYSWTHVKWFFPEHILWSRLAIPPGPDWDRPWTLSLQTQYREDDLAFYRAHLDGPSGTEHPIPANIHRVIVFDFQLAGENGGTRTIRPEVEVYEARLSNDWRVLVFDVDAEHPTIESYFLDSGNRFL
ncbi:MAG: DUF2723 domain-containing protein [Candidatus Thermoplasmatota archaeon]|jgi:hypothetical protein